MSFPSSTSSAASFLESRLAHWESPKSDSTENIVETVKTQASKSIAMQQKRLRPAVCKAGDKTWVQLVINEKKGPIRTGNKDSVGTYPKQELKWLNQATAHHVLAKGKDSVGTYPKQELECYHQPAAHYVLVKGIEGKVTLYECVLRKDSHLSELPK